MSVTYVAIPFFRTEDGKLEPGETIEVQTATAAITKARHLSSVYAGVIALARTGNSALGEFQPGVILASYGETPDEVE